MATDMRVEISFDSCEVESEAAGMSNRELLPGKIYRYVFSGCHCVTLGPRTRRDQSRKQSMRI